MKRWAIVFSPLFFYIFYGLALSQFQLNILSTAIDPANPPGYYDYRGVTHVHSNRSSGAASSTEIVEQAQAADLDFVIMTDLNVFEEEAEPPTYYGKTLLAKAGEYGYLDTHLLYYDAPREFRNISGAGQAQIHFSDLLSQKKKEAGAGLLVLAHPLQKGYRWSGEYPTGLDGLEIINLASVWELAKKDTPLSLAWSFFIYPFNPHLATFRLTDEDPDEVELWDQLLTRRPVIGMVGNDTSAKAFTISGRPFEFPSYKTSFEIASNHLLLKSELTGDPESDYQKIIAALRSGQFYIALDIFAKTQGFFAELRQGKRTFPLGSRVRLQRGMELYVSLPQKPNIPFEIVVLKDGQRVLTSNSQRTSMDIHVPGVYRIMVRVSPTLPLPDGIHWYPWIYTNPFFVEP